MATKKQTTAQEADLAAAGSTHDTEVVEAELVDESAPAGLERVETPAYAEPAAAPHVIVVDAPVAPRAIGNRGLGVALAFVATLVFVGLLFTAALMVNGLGAFLALADPTFYFPALFFFIGTVLVSLVLNRAGWWSHIIGSVVVGVIVWFGSAALVLVSAGMLSMNQTEANDVYFASLFSPLSIISALLAREVAVWTGAILARRGRSLKVRNAEARAAFEREQAELIPTA